MSEWISPVDAARTHLAYLIWCYGEGYVHAGDRGSNWLLDDLTTLNPDDVVLRRQLLAMADEVLGALDQLDGSTEAERDRLRAVVEAVKEYRLQHGQFWLLENNEDEAVAAAERESRAWSGVVSALDQLDGSTDMGGGPFPSRRGGNRER